MSISEKPRPSRVPLAWLARLWLLGIAILLAADWLSSSFRLGWITRIYFWGTLFMSAVCLIAYGIDKRRANLDKRRIPEKQLHLLEILGGWPGAVMGQQMFRHKTIKMSFRIVLWAIILLHVGLSGYFVFEAVRERQERQELIEKAARIPASMENAYTARTNSSCRLVGSDVPHRLAELR